MGIVHSVGRASQRLLPRDFHVALRHRYEALSPKRLVFHLPRRLFGRFQYPEKLTIALTSRCNLNCSICKRDRIVADDMEFDNLRALDTAIRHAVTINLTGLGETLLYPKFADVLEYIYERNTADDLIQVITNGTRLTAEVGTLLSGHLKALVVSLNAASAATYNRDMKGADFEGTLAAIRAAMDALTARDRRRVKLHFVAHTGNYHEIPDFVELAADLGVRALSFGQYLAHDPVDLDRSILHVRDGYNEAVALACARASELGIMVDARRFFEEKRRPTRECLAPFRECAVTISGDVTPCCYVGGETMGNVYESGFDTVWFGARYRELRRHRNLAGCRNCAPFVPLDEVGAHMASTLKRKTRENSEQTRDR